MHINSKEKGPLRGFSKTSDSMALENNNSKIYMQTDFTPNENDLLLSDNDDQHAQGISMKDGRNKKGAYQNSFKKQNMDNQQSSSKMVQHKYRRYDMLSTDFDVEHPNSTTKDNMQSSSPSTYNNFEKTYVGH